MGEPLYVSAPLLPYISRSQVPDRRKAIGRDNYYIICGGFKMTTGDLIQTLSRWGFEINQVWLRRLVYLGVARKPDKRQKGGRGKVADRPADNLYDIATALFLRQHRGIKLEDSAWARKHMAELWGDDWTSDKKSLSGELVMAMAVDNSAGGQKQFSSLALDRLADPAGVEQESFRLAWILREYLLVRICYKNGYQPGHPGLRIVWYEHPGQGVEPKIAIPLGVPRLP